MQNLCTQDTSSPVSVLKSHGLLMFSMSAFKGSTVHFLPMKNMHSEVTYSDARL